MSETSTVAKKRHPVARVSDIAPGQSRVVTVELRGKPVEIGIFNVGGVWVAYRNVCPHAGAPVCLGKVCGTTLPSDVYQYELAREGEILRCPWHGWEFDLLNGEHLVDEHLKLKAYPVETGEENLQSFDVETSGGVVYLLI